MQKRNMCICCGVLITKSARADPFMCRLCETAIREGEEVSPYNWLDA